MKTACITGITGQTGSYLAEILLDKGYEVYGLIRRASSINTDRINHIYDNPRLKLIYGDLASYASLESFIQKAMPDEFYNLSAMSHVRVSFDIPEYTLDINATGVLRCLEALRKNSPETRYLQASTSENFGSSPPPQNEKTPFHPRSPYACAKVAGYWLTVNYREAYNMFAVNSMSFNHESKLRGETFVTKKITKAASRIKLGLQDKLVLGNLESKRDWSHAKDVANGMFLILNAEKPEDYVIGSEESHSVQEFLEIVFDKLDLNWKDHVEFDEKYLRPAEVDHLRADASKIKKNLGWKPEYNFEQLVDEMVKYDFKESEKELYLKGMK